MILAEMEIKIVSLHMQAISVDIMAICSRELCTFLTRKWYVPESSINMYDLHVACKRLSVRR